MLGLKFSQLCLAFDASFDSSIAIMKEDDEQLNDILAVQPEEYPETKKAVEQLISQFENLNLSNDDMMRACYLTILKVIEINNRAIQNQLDKVGISL